MSLPCGTPVCGDTSEVPNSTIGNISITTFPYTGLLYSTTAEDGGVTIVLGFEEMPTVTAMGEILLHELVHNVSKPSVPKRVV